MKRNRESKCRIKIIQEEHLDKGCQVILDDLISKTKDRYHTVYTGMRTGKSTGYMTIIGFRRVGTMASKCGSSVSEVNERLRRFANAVFSAIISQE